jgi:hypothetical protein
MSATFKLALLAGIPTGLIAYQSLTRDNPFSSMLGLILLAAYVFVLKLAHEERETRQDQKPDERSPSG